MRYSLSSRFRGALLGAALGELLGAYCRRSPRSSGNWAAAEWTATPLPIETRGWGRLAVETAQQLMADGQPPQLPLTTPASAAGIAVALLPVTLFFHEDLDQLRHQLAAATAPMQPSPELSDSVLAISAAIALAMQERLDPPQLIPQLIDGLSLAGASPQLSNLLRQIQSWLHQHSLSTLLPAIAADPTAPSRSTLLPLAIAFYCFLSTPEEFGLTLRRIAVGVAQSGRRDLMAQLPALTAIGGALSGAYGSTAGIPIDWRRGVSRPIDDPPLARLWSLATEAKIVQLADQLLAVWSGAYNASFIAQSPLPVTAAPYVIRAR